MTRHIVCCLSITAVTLLTAPLLAEEKLSPPRAALVNGEPILEVAVQRALKPVPAEHQAKGRQEILNFLIDMTLIDQYLARLHIPVPKEEIDARLKRLREESKTAGRDFDTLLKQLMLTEDELRVQLTADLRWENFVKAKTNEKILADFFTANRDWFDGSQLRARHILVAVAAGAEPKTRSEAFAKLQGIQKQIESKVAEAIAKVDPKTDALIREQTRLKVLAEVFAQFASAQSDCPSKKNGGDLGWFPRIGSMVEPFAKAAFRLQPGQMTELVETQFGYHIILVTGRMPGKDVKFDDMKDDVRDIYAEKLREELLPQLRQTARIEIVEPRKP